jgi:hypothetical protein
VTVDIGALAGRGRTTVESVIRTSGTRVDFYADADDLDETIDFDTLAITDPTPDRAVLRDVPALIVTEGTDTTQLGVNRDAHPPVYRVLLLPAVTGVQEQMIGLVRRCRNPQLVGARLRISEVIVDGFGIVLTLRGTRL